MKRLMLGTAMAIVLGSAASAQEMFRTEMEPVAITASDFIGKRVYAAEAAIDATEYAGVQDSWNDIGEINDVILTREGKVDAVLVDIGGFLGMGERQVAVGMENIRFVADSATPDDVNDFFLVINADRGALEAAPPFVRNTEQSAAATPPATGDAAMEQTAAETEGTQVATPETTEGAVADATPDNGAALPEGYTAVDMATLSTEQLMGVRVYGPNQEDLGEISQVVGDSNAQGQQVIIDVGGFLGIGEKPVALELGSLTFAQPADGGALRAYVPMTEEQVEKLPEAAM